MKSTSSESNSSNTPPKILSREQKQKLEKKKKLSRTLPSVTNLPHTFHLYSWLTFNSHINFHPSLSYLEIHKSKPQIQDLQNLQIYSKQKIVLHTKSPARPWINAKILNRV